MEKKTAVLFVCLGNICRSPLAEGLFLQALEERGLAHLFEVNSCGTSGQHDGELPDRRTRQNALFHGVALTHSSRRIRPRDLAHFDRILVMDDSNLQNVRALCTTPEQYAKVEKIRSIDPDAPNADVDDPWFGGPDGFEAVYQVLERVTARWLELLVSEAKN